MIARYNAIDGVDEASFAMLDFQVLWCYII